MTVEPTVERFTVQPHWRVLCVVAHPDDLEYGTSAAVAAWTDSGVEVAYLLLTSGEAGMQRSPQEVGPLRAKEQADACATVGVEELQILGYPDGMLTYSLELRRDIARAIRTFKPHVVVTTNFDVEAYGGLNQADHRVAGLVTIDAIRDADNTWVFQELADEGLAKWATSWLLVGGHPDPTHGVEVDQSAVDRGVASLTAHRAYLADLPDHPQPEAFIPAILADGGAAMDCQYAQLFRAFRMGGIAAEPGEG